MHDLIGGCANRKTSGLGVPYMGSKKKHADKLINKMLELQPHAKYFYDVFAGGGAMSFAALEKGLIVVYNDAQKDMVDFMQFIFESIQNPKSKYGIFPDEYYNFVTRDDFVKLRHENGVYAQFVRIVYSFGNNQKNYLFNPVLEKIKHLANDVVMFQCDTSLNELNNVLNVDLQMSAAKHWNERRLDFRRSMVKMANTYAIRLCGSVEGTVSIDQLQQLERLQQLEQNITFTNLDYRDVKITTPIKETIVYCDPPYRGTAKYINGLSHTELDSWFASLPHLAFISEYNAPFESVFDISTRSTLSATNNKCAKVEKLYVNT